MAVRTPGDTRPMAQPQRPTGADSYPPQSLGPNGGPGRTVRPTEGRPFALHSNDLIDSIPFLNKPVRSLTMNCRASHNYYAKQEKRPKSPEQKVM